MTPCGYNGSNFQWEGSKFGALDLWCGFNDQSQVDNEIYVNIPHRYDVRLPL